MSKVKKKGRRPNSAKTLIERAKREVPGFVEQFAKFEEQTTINGYAASTIFNYSRAVAKISLHFRKSLLDLDPEEVNQFLYILAKEKKASSTYFKHTVYGLRFFFRLYDLEDRALRLPMLKADRKLPFVLSPKELKRLFFAPQRLKQRVLLCLIYSAGLRIGEVSRLKVSDIDADRMQIRVVKSKGKMDRYVPLSPYLLTGLRKYYKSSKPKDYLFNGRRKGDPLSHSAIHASFRLAVNKAGILKEVSVHSLRHSYATHLLEQGLDIVTIKELLGHQDIATTMMYLHVAKVNRVHAHSPLDRLYNQK